MKIIWFTAGFLLLFGNNAHAQNDVKIPLFDYSKPFQDERITRVPVGEADFPTGKIIVSDPFFTMDQKPFKKTIEPGKYTAELLMCKIEEDHYRVAFAKLKIRNEVAVKWELALTEDITDEEVAKLKQDEIFGFGVDAGMACFIDVETDGIYQKKIDQFYQERPDANYYHDLLAQEFDTFSGKSPFSRSLGDWNMHRVDDKHAFPMFASGWGDGYYECFWGLNEQHEIVELVIDFLVISGE